MEDCREIQWNGLKGLLSGMVLGILSCDVFERRTSTGSEPFPILIGFNVTKFVLPSVFTLSETIDQKCVQNHGSRVQKVYFRLTSVAQKRRCLSSLFTNLWRHPLCPFLSMEGREGWPRPRVLLSIHVVSIGVF